MKKTNVVPISVYQRDLIEAKAVTAQIMCDAAQIALNEEFNFGADRCEKFVNQLIKTYSEICDIFNADIKDREYAKAKLDERLQEVCKEKFVPFQKRYSI